MPTIWIDTPIDLAVASGGNAFISLMTGVSATQTRFDRMTLLRTIIGIDIGVTIHDSGEGSQIFACGIGITSQEAFAAGIFSDPFTATDFPARGWVWRAHYRIFGFAADQPAVFSRRVELDLRGKRKLENGEAFMNFDNQPQEGVANPITPVGLIRQLWLVG